MHLKPLLIACFLLTGLSTFAQEKAITIGFKAGAGISSLSRTKAQDIVLENPEKSAFGYSAGVYANLRMGNFALQPGINYVMKGGKTTEMVVQGDILYNMYGTMRMSYLEVPVNLVYNLPVSGGSFFFGAGPYLAKGLKASFRNDMIKGQGSNGYYVINSGFGSSDTNNFKSMDYGANALAGYKLNNGLQFNLSYTRGLRNIQQKNFLYDAAKTRVLLLSVGYEL